MGVPRFPIFSRIPVIGKQVFLHFDKKREVELAAQAIADELDLNADEAAQSEPHGNSTPPSGLSFHFAEWEAHNKVVRTLGHPRSNPELLKDVRELYRRLHITVSQGQYPLHADEIRQVAQRLRNARY